MLMSSSTSKRAAALGALTMSLSTGAASAQDFEEGGKLYAVQNRKHLATHEFTLGVGTLPIDAFVKGITFNAAYTLHFNDLWAWEIGSFTYSLNVDTSLRRQLTDNFNVSPTRFPELQLFGGSNLVWKPLYGKLAYLNDSLVYAELYLTAGVAVANYVNAGVHVGLNAGIGLRIYLSKAFSVRLDIRDYQFANASTFQDFPNALWLQLGTSISLQ
jgi:outer membrane beta-barrel protein